jgi:hypothetical protein
MFWRHALGVVIFYDRLLEDGMTRFVVDLGDIALSREVQATISEDIQKTVLGHVARLQLDKPFVTKFPKEWWGLIMHDHFDGLFDLEALNQKAFAAAGVR